MIENRIDELKTIRDRVCCDCTRPRCRDDCHERLAADMALFAEVKRVIWAAVGKEAQNDDG